MVEWKDGDIYERRIDDGPSIYKVIVKKHRRSAVVLRIYNVPQNEHNFAVNARGWGYVGAGYLYSESMNALSEAEYVRSLTEEEYESLLLAIANALGFEAEAAVSTPKGSGEPITQGTEVNVPGKPASSETIPEPVLYPVELARIAAERDVYKELTYELLKGKGVKR